LSLVVLSACAGGGAEREVVQHPPAEGVEPPSGYVSLASDGPLYGLAEALDSSAIRRSAVMQDQRAAQAILQARGYDRYPQVRPQGGVDLQDGPVATIGPSVSQVIWDGGRSRAALRDAELDVALAGLRAWVVRNEGVYDGLSAYVDMSRYQARLRVYSEIERELDELTELLELRAQGGVSDRGELLRMNVARQEIQREIVGDRAALRQARSDLERFLPGSADMRPLSDLAGAAAQCRRRWPQSEPPQDALARMQISETQIAEDRTRAQRFPSLVLGAGAAATTLASAVTPGVSVNVDTTDMLGMGARLRLEAAELESEAAIAAYDTQRQDTAAELARLDAHYAEMRDSLRQLQALQRTNRETVALYREQVDGGTISLVEGVALYREVARTDVDIVDLHADALINCLRASQVRGLLAPFGSSEAATVSTSND
jgi:adhesin transport system outer membrane protein